MKRDKDSKKMKVIPFYGGLPGCLLFFFLLSFLPAQERAEAPRQKKPQTKTGSSGKEASRSDSSRKAGATEGKTSAQAETKKSPKEAASSLSSGEGSADPATGSPAPIEETEPDFPGMLGMTPPEAFQRLGTPEALQVYREKKPGGDSIIFIYSDFLSLFWFRDRVWQIRFPRSYKKPFLGLTMGLSQELIEQRMGPPGHKKKYPSPGGTGSETESWAYRMEDIGFPVILRLFFEGNLLVDAYLYRGDF